jgi:hypothetical protein
MSTRPVSSTASVVGFIFREGAYARSHTEGSGK